MKTISTVTCTSASASFRLVADIPNTFEGGGAASVRRRLIANYLALRVLDISLFAQATDGVKSDTRAQSIISIATTVLTDAGAANATITWAPYVNTPGAGLVATSIVVVVSGA